MIGQRQRLRALVRELSPECLDTAGHTPLMYAVFGNQTKVTPHLFHSLPYLIKELTFIDLSSSSTNGNQR